MLHVIVGALFGFAVGVTTPGLIARIRQDAKKEVSLVEGEVKAAEATIKADAKKL